MCDPTYNNSNNNNTREEDISAAITVSRIATFFGRPAVAIGRYSDYILFLLLFFTRLCSWFAYYDDRHRHYIQRRLIAERRGLVTEFLFIFFSFSSFSSLLFFFRSFSRFSPACPYTGSTRGGYQIYRGWRIYR